ncbi:hypothetical protein A9Q78_03335 [Methylophaga sp. 41_12_T18]|nr:hypothetical protein A9Q78_03335 [Methylophaga sp. 41_12_T18]
MANESAAKPSLVPAILALLVLIVVGYFLFSDSKPSRTEHTLNPPIEIVDPEPPLTIIEEVEPAPTSDEVTEQEAQAFVEALTTPQQQTIIAITEGQDQFVRHDGFISLPNLENRTTTAAQLLADTSLTGDTELTVSYINEQHITTSLAELAESIEDHTAAITIINNDGSQITAPLADLINQANGNTAASITYIKKTTVIKQLTISEFAHLDIASNQAIQVTINHGEQQLSIKEIIQSADIADNELFYLHRVSEQDQQGLWGIIQAGLIDKFRQGLSIEGISRNKDLMQVTIPADADEKLTSGLSSFLGKILNSKVTSSYIYNYSSQTMGHDPDVIHPGQQLVLIHFSAGELKQVYQFFSAKRNQGIQTFAIVD